MNEWRRAVAFTALVASASFGGCASLMMQERVYPCTWLEVSAPPEVQALGPRQAGLRLANCGSAGEFRLERPTYVLEFWNGIGAQSSLYARATRPGGNQARLESAEFTELDQAALRLRPALTGRASEFTHRLKLFVPRETPSPRAYPLTLTIRILDDSGAVLGTETITLIEGRGTYRELDGV